MVLGARKLSDETGVSKKKSSLESHENLPDDLAAAVDTFTQIGQEIKALEAKRAEAKQLINEYGPGLWAESCIKKGSVENLKLIGDNASCSYIIKNALGAGMVVDQEKFDDLAKEFGSQIVEETFALDYSTFKLSAMVMADPVKAERVSIVIEKLEKELGCQVLIRGTYKLKESVVTRVLKYFKTAKKLLDYVDAIKLQKFPQG